MKGILPGSVYDIYFNFVINEMKQKIRVVPKNEENCKFITIL